MTKESCLVMKVASCSFLFLYIRPINCCSMVKIFCSDYRISSHVLYVPYARHHNPLLIRNRSWILTIHKSRILRKKPLEKTFLDFKKWVKRIQTAGYNGARMVFHFIKIVQCRTLYKILLHIFNFQNKIPKDRSYFISLKAHAVYFWTHIRYFFALHFCWLFLDGGLGT